MLKKRDQETDSRTQNAAAKAEIALINYDFYNAILCKFITGRKAYS